MRRLTIGQQAAKLGRTGALLFVVFTGREANAGPPEGFAPAALESADLGPGPTTDLPTLAASRPPAVQLLWFDPTEALSSSATDALAEEVRSIFRKLGVEVAFRAASPNATYGDDAVTEVPVILLKEDPIVARRPKRVMGLVVRHQEPNRAVWAFRDNVSWTLGYGLARGLAPTGHQAALGVALGRVVAHEVIHAIAPDEPHSNSGLMSHSMNRAFLLSGDAPLEGRCGRAFLSGLSARAARLPANARAGALASVR